MSKKPLKHIGIILDGNRRWAKANGKKTVEGHKKGAEVFKQVSLSLFDKDIEYVSAFVFSTENWQRANEEVDYLMKLVVKAVELHLEEYNKKGIRIRVLGSRESLTPTVLAAIERTEDKTKGNGRGTLALCFNYGGRNEIVEACRAIVDSGVKSEKISEDTITNSIYCSDIPNVDLVVRTSGEQRISGFMLWRAAYAEFSFIDKFWPDITVEDFDKVIDDYTCRDRRFGC